MRIDPKLCVACGNCVAVCPMGAIHIGESNRAVVNRDECVECYTCFRGMSQEHLNPVLVRTVRSVLGLFRLRFQPDPDICPTAAIVPDEIEWPRTVRRAFSDPLVTHEATGVHGRGTEEVKTNDVTGRVGVGEAGMVVEFGRPTVGVWFRDIEIMTRALAAAGAEFEPNNPVAKLMTDQQTGRLQPDILDEKVLSAIVEIKTTIDDAARVLQVVEDVSSRIETVVSVGVSTRCDSDGNDDLGDILEQAGYALGRAKTNVGLGRSDLAHSGNIAASSAVGT